MNELAGKPKVTVCVSTYNQEAYIATSLQSVVDQKADFPIEVIVSDDCSTDGTRTVVREFLDRYPGKISAMFSEANLGASYNFRKAHRAARGDYVAHLDGDDYMLPGKLARQVQVLDSAPECPAVFHQLMMVDHAGRDIPQLWPACAPERIDVAYLLQQHPIFGPSSMMYRSGLLKEFLVDRHTVDLMLYTHLALRGPLAFLNEKLGVYRLGVGISRVTYEWIGKLMDAFDFAEAQGIPTEITNRGRANQFFQAAHNALCLTEYGRFRELIEASVKFSAFSPLQMAFYRLRRHPKALMAMHRTYTAARKYSILPDVRRRFR